MKYLLNPIKGFIYWTWQCFIYWLQGIEMVTKRKPVYWNIANTFTETENELNIYLQEVEKVIKKLNNIPTKP